MMTAEKVGVFLKDLWEKIYFGDVDMENDEDDQPAEVRYDPFSMRHYRRDIQVRKIYGEDSMRRNR